MLLQTARPPETLILDRVETPIGVALLVADDAGVLRAVNWADYEAHLRAWIARRYPTSALVEAKTSARTAFEAYFAGDINALSAVPWNGAGTAFQRRVWSALCDIPVGETWTYARLARAVGQPTAVRAVGLANGANPVALVAPCHRVIGSDGALTGYAGGLARKRWLLTHEGAAFKERLAA
jgi:O-6-methylguanine DNA methyltransferase